MNSLRTDDILGAKPRVRHMPKNLIRERSIPTSFLTNLALSNPEFEQIARSQVHYQQPLPDSSPHYQDSDANAYLYARDRLPKEPRYVNYDLPREQPKLHQEPAASRANQSVELSRTPSEHRYQSGSKLEGQRASQDSSRREGARGEGEEWERSRASSRRSAENKEGREESKRIFRGLGFNIISNHKYEYTFEHKLPTHY